MKKVFWKCVSDGGEYIHGREYENSKWADQHSDEGAIIQLSQKHGYAAFRKIERDCFEALGHTWFRHTNDEKAWPPVGAIIYLLFGDGFQLGHEVGKLREERAGESPIGWRFADSAPTKPSPSDWTEYPHSTAGMTLQPKGAGEFKGYDDLPGPPPQQSAPFDSFAWLEFLKLAAPDVAAVEDTSLPPRHRKIVNAKEDAQAEREKAAAEALAKSEQEKSDRLKRDGEALVRDFDNLHDHRMGYPCATGGW